jgi:hypothetical protein
MCSLDDWCEGCLDELFWHIRLNSKRVLPSKEDVCYANTRLESENPLSAPDPMFRLLVDVHRVHGDHQLWDNAQGDSMPWSFLMGISAKYGKIHGFGHDTDALLDVCDYRDHGNGKEEIDACRAKQTEKKERMSRGRLIEIRC